ncbi:MAG TPA: alpha/beta hydrolase [Tepidiformaceae bacterium]|nr:alpha/beta hydrolase [Tepidiformaceae bacterium]
MREPIESTLQINGLNIATYAWPGSGTPVFFAHATGFHARCWDQVIERLPGVPCFAIDMRGHGKSDKPEPPYNWPDFAADVAAAARQLELDGAVAVGHSKGGYAIALAAARDPGPFGRLLLIDPVILTRDRYNASVYGQDHFAARRRNEWDSPHEMFERFKDRPPFSLWDPAVLHDYCDYGLVPNPNGDGYVLACPPEIEAATYAGSSRGGEIYDALPNLRIPVRILRALGNSEAAPMDMSRSPTAPDIASAFPNAEDVYLPQYTHFMPMQDPGFIAGQVRELLSKP